jgi:hypothetical protein
VELQQTLPLIQAQGLGVAAISYDSAAVLRNFSERRGITFPLLSDSSSKTIAAFGILNEEVPPGTPFRGIPYPGTFIVDANGRVVAKYFEEDFTQRYTASDILVREFSAAGGAAKSEAETRHLKLAASASAAGAQPGQRIALILDVDLKPKMHVYAPGVEGYIAIDWSMQPAGAVIVHRVQFPPAQPISLPAIGETVPAYSGRFRLVRDITIGDEKAVRQTLGADGLLTVEGAFRYQACDDRMCYLPVTVPLKWKIRIAEQDRQRAPRELRRESAR